MRKGEQVMENVKSSKEARLVMKYFVLNPNKRGPFGKASRAAMLEYSRIIAPTHPIFAEDMVKWVDAIVNTMIEEDTKNG